MNFHEYTQLVNDFFKIIFNNKYLKVSIPFIILVIGFIWIITSYYYKWQIKKIKNKATHDLIILQNDMVSRNHQYHQNNQNQQTLELYPSLSNYYSIPQNVNLVATAPPQYIIQQNDFSSA